MTEVEKELDSFFSYCSESKSTCQIYRAAYRRFRAHVPMSAWDDIDTVLRYRGLLKKSLQGVFGVMFGKLYEEAKKRRVPCLKPDQLRWQFTFPHPIASSIQRLSIYSSYPQLAELRWSDVRLIGGSVYAGRSEIPENAEVYVEEIRSHFWHDATPPADAPVIALSFATRLTPISPEMVEAIVRDMDRTNIFGIESAFGYETYRVLAKFQVGVKEYEELFHLLYLLTRLSVKEREKGRKTLEEAKAALTNRDITEFFRLLNHAAVGDYEKRRPTMQESVAAIMQRKTLLPSRPPGLALSDDLG